ncbi:MAG: hypothetical protein ACTSVY_10935 [Candidatus Helarchaeota archaeon]
MVNGVHLLKMEKIGPSVISLFPETLSRDQIQKKVIKLLPFNAKEGEVFSLIAENNLVYLSYIFTMDKSSNERPDLYALDVVFNPLEDFTNYQGFFQALTSQLKENNLISDDLLISLVPKLYKALKKGKTSIEITKNVSISIKFGGSSSGTKKSLEDRADELW